MVNKPKSKHAANRRVMERDGDVIFRIEKNRGAEGETSVDVQR